MKCRWREGWRSSGEGNEVIRQENREVADEQGRTNEADSGQVRGAGGKTQQTENQENKILVITETDSQLCGVQTRVKNKKAD